MISVLIVDARGSVVMNKQVQMNGYLTTSLDVSKLANGTYFLSVQTEKEMQTIPFNKQ